MGVILALIESGASVLKHQDASRLGIVFDSVNDNYTAAPFHLPGVPEQVGSAANYLRVCGQSRVGGQPLGHDASNPVVAHQRIAETDDEDWFHRLRTRCTEQEMQGS
jgi:hypothetical protein